MRPGGGLAVTIRMLGTVDYLSVLTPFQYFVAVEVARTGPDPAYVVLALHESVQ